MKKQHTRLFRRLACLAVAAAVAAPAATAAVDPESPTLRNDIAHFGAPQSQRAQSSPTLRNDQAHFGTPGRSSAATTSAVPQDSLAPTIVRIESGFDWVSAGVGAAGGLGFVLVAAAAAAALRGRHGVDAARA